MKARGMVMIVVVLLAVVALTAWLSGCNTWAGAGKDVQKTGEAMQGD
jgi:predicted small secreted protein